MNDDLRQAVLAFLSAPKTVAVADRETTLLKCWKDAWGASKCPFKIKVVVESPKLTKMTLTRSTGGVQTIVTNMIDDFSYDQCEQAAKMMVEQIKSLTSSDPSKRGAKRMKM